MKAFKQFLIVIPMLTVGMFLWMMEYGGLDPAGLNSPPQSTIETPAPDEAPRLSSKQLKHILHGDDRGGGHLYGTNAPCKSEFPRSWDADFVEEIVTQIAANDNLPWEKQNNGYWVAQTHVHGVKLRIVLDRERDDIVTAYPLDVKRNPCPANDR